MITEKKPVLPPMVVAYIEQCQKKEHSESYLISVLQKVQKEMGYLSREAMDEVSTRMQIPSARVTGVATFYHFFCFQPRGRCEIVVCMGTACFVKGAGKVLERFKELLQIKEGQTTPDGAFSIECARCLGACALAPVVVVSGRVYPNVKTGDVRKILEEHGFAAKPKGKASAPAS
jgi:NADH:ubiquinone oxidoreductase subunit E